jgi:hypothetical protein
LRQLVHLRRASYLLKRAVADTRPIVGQTPPLVTVPAQQEAGADPGVDPGCCRCMAALLVGLDGEEALRSPEAVDLDAVRSRRERC